MEGYDQVQVRYRLDVSSYLGAVARLLLPALAWVGGVVLGVLLFVAVLVGLLTGDREILLVGSTTAVLASAIATLVLGARSLFNVWLAMQRERERFPLGDVTLSLGERGFVVDSGESNSVLGWIYLYDVWVTRSWVFLLTARYQGVPVPRSALGDRQAVRDFVTRVRALKAAAPADEAVPEAEARVQSEETATYKLSYRNDFSDFVALSRWRLRQRNRRRWVALLLALVALFLGGCSGLLLIVFDGMISEGLLLVGLGVLAIVVGTAGFWAGLLAPIGVRRAMRRYPRRYTDAVRRLVAGPEGMVVSLPSGRSELPWGRMHEVARDGSRVYLCLDPVHAYVVPPSAFERAEDADRFYTDTAAWLARARTRPNQPRTDQRHAGGGQAKADPFAPPDER